MSIAPGQQITPSDNQAVAETVAAGEAVLFKRMGSRVKLVQPTRLSGAGRGVVIRVHVEDARFFLPKTLIIKRYPESAAGHDPFAHEVASHRLLTALPVEKRATPELVGHDDARRLVILEDLGTQSRLTDKLHGGNARNAERSLLAWAHALGKLHAATAGRSADFAALMRRQGESDCPTSDISDLPRAVAELPDLINRNLGVPRVPQVDQFAQHALVEFARSERIAFSPATSCPDNHMVTSRGARFVDFERGCVRDVIFDAACLRVPFPSCWCAYGLPLGMSEAMVAAWRAEVLEVWPELADDAVLMPLLLRAQVLWVWHGTWLGLPKLNDPVEVANGVSRGYPPRDAVVTRRWTNLGNQARALGQLDLSNYAEQVAHALARQLDFRTELSLFPAFRG